MKLKKLGAFAATGAMALALALTGCGSSNATSGSDAGSSSPDNAKVEKVDGSKEYALVKDGTLTVGTSAEYAPFEYKDDNGDYQGFDLELIKAIADKLGLDVEYVNNDFDTLVPALLRAPSTTSPLRLSLTHPSVRRKSLSPTPTTWMTRLS